MKINTMLLATSCILLSSCSGTNNITKSELKESRKKTYDIHDLLEHKKFSYDSLSNTYSIYEG